MSCILLFVTFLSGCAGEIQRAKTPTEKMFYQIIDVALYSLITTVILLWVLDFINIKIKQWYRIFIFLGSAIVFAFIQFGQSQVQMPGF